MLPRAPLLFRHRSTLGFLVALLLSAAPLSAVEEPRAWLERMLNAARFSNYEGTMVYLLGGDTSVLKVIHRVENGHVTERIISVDAGREVIRDDGKLTCLLPDECPDATLHQAAGHAHDGALSRRLGGVANVNPGFYNTAFAGAERIAGRDARILAIRPKDGYRYGYRLWLDRATAMPLKTQLIAEDGSLLEQVLFTEIALAASIPDSAVRPARRTGAQRPHRAATADSPPFQGRPVEWEAARLPPGFRLTVPDAKHEAPFGNWLHHLVYSDGLATVSLFIEPAVAASEQAEGLSQVGAANAFTTITDGYMLTAVGEVPVETVEMLARSARPLEAPGRQ